MAFLCDFSFAESWLRLAHPVASIVVAVAVVVEDVAAISLVHSNPVADFAAAGFLLHLVCLVVVPADIAAAAAAVVDLLVQVPVAVAE